MTLVNARAALEAAINTAVTDADDTVSVVFDNMPFTTPGKTKKYVMVTILCEPIVKLKRKLKMINSLT